MAKVISFYVHHIFSRQSGRITVDGRCCDDAIKRGDIFRVVFRHLFPKDMQGFAEKRAPMAQRHVSLRVVSMTAYDRPFEELDPGLTARIELEGVGGELLMEDDILGSEYAPG